MTYLHKNVKLRVGGRKAPKLSKEEALEIFTKMYEKAVKRVFDPEGFSIEDIQGPPKSYQWIFWIGYTNEVFPKMYDDLFSKVDVDLENTEAVKDELEFTSTGIPYVSFDINGDWEWPVMVFVYWDGKQLRSYVPTKGNTFRTDEKKAFGSDTESTRESYLKKFADSPFTDWGDININRFWCLEDFESRLEVI